MGTCKYCGQSAGLLSHAHKECEEKHEQGLEQLEQILRQFFTGQQTVQSMRQAIVSLRTPTFLKKSEVEQCAAKVLDVHGEQLRPPYNQQTLDQINDFINGLSLDRQTLNERGCLNKLAEKLLRGYLASFFVSGTPIATIKSQEQQIDRVLPMTQSQKLDAYMHVLNRAAHNFLSNGLISDSEQQQIEQYAQSLSLPLYDLPAQYKGTDIEKVNQAIIIKNLQRGILPQSGISLPVLLGKSEAVLWVYDGVTYYQEKIEKEYRHNSGGFSFRVAKGVYYRTGSGRSKPIEHSVMNNEGKGSLIITNKNIIFYAQTKSVKIPFKKIIGVTPYSDGIEVHKDGNAKRMAFQGFDCWFVMNILSFVND